jgi:hypothetical protein
MIEKPILFSTPMVRAILEGNKTVTRRIMKPQIKPCDHASFTEAPWKNEPTKFFMRDNEWACEYCGNGVQYARGIKCPYGQPGDRLWVRETWTRVPMQYEAENDYAYKADEVDDDKYIWRPSIHMPRAACRLILEVVSIQAEPLQAITEKGAFREGIDADNYDYQAAEHYLIGGSPVQGGSPARFAFIALWNKINGTRGMGWEKNPWVWVVQFKVV